MIHETNLIVRVSGKKPNCYYIDCQGVYKVSEIAKVINSDAAAVKEKYLSNGAEYDEELELYYFGSNEAAQKAISDILKGAKIEKNGRFVYLTEAEIEYIRKALINEGSNVLHVSNKVKDAIFKKLNA